MSWSVVKFDANHLDIQLFFEEPLYISFESEADTVVVNFADEELFISEDGIKILPEDRVLRRKLPRQLPESAVSVQETIDGTA